MDTRCPALVGEMGRCPGPMRRPGAHGEIAGVSRAGARPQASYAACRPSRRLPGPGPRRRAHPAGSAGRQPGMLRPWATATSSVRAPPEAVRYAGWLRAVRPFGLSPHVAPRSMRAAVGWSSSDPTGRSVDPRNPACRRPGSFPSPAERRRALAAAVTYLRCPVCAGPVYLGGSHLACGRGHSFDIARHGYASRSATTA